jgi:hypothetical protein
MSSDKLRSGRAAKKTRSKKPKGQNRGPMYIGPDGAKSTWAERNSTIHYDPTHEPTQAEIDEWRKGQPAPFKSTKDKP